MKKLKFAALAAAVSGVASSAIAAVDTAGVQTAITGAQGSAETVGGYVIAAVAALVVVGLIIGIVKKL